MQINKNISFEKITGKHINFLSKCKIYRSEWINQEFISSNCTIIIIILQKTQNLSDFAKEGLSHVFIFLTDTNQDIICVWGGIYPFMILNNQKSSRNKKPALSFIHETDKLLTFLDYFAIFNKVLVMERYRESFVHLKPFVKKLPRVRIHHLNG